MQRSTTRFNSHLQPPRPIRSRLTESLRTFFVTLRMGGMARVEQITDKSQVPAEYHALYDRIVAARGRVAGPYSILLHAPAVCDRVDGVASSLRDSSELKPDEFVLAALETGVASFERVGAVLPSQRKMVE